MNYVIIKNRICNVKHFLWNRTIFLFMLITTILSFTSKLYAQKNMWVGETYMCDATSAVMGLTSDVSWTTNGGYLSLSGSGFYRNVTVTQYFSGSATVKCSWKYRLYSGDTWKSQSKTWTIRCNENPVSISPTNLTLSPGKTAYVSYSHKYNNSYTYAANAYFSSSNTRIATVSSSGLVTAINPGTAYINVYSKISNAANAPYCIVTVKESTPTGVSLPSSLNLIIGESKTLTPIVTPSGASTSFSWSSENNNIAKVNSSGIVTGVKVGSTKIKVTTDVGGYTAYCNITVKEPPVAPTKITVKDTINLYKGFTYTLVPTLQPDNAETTYTWKSDNTSIAIVSTTGKITAKETGVATITVTTKNNLKATCRVTVLELPAYISESTINSKIAIIENLVNKTFNKAY